MATNLSDTVIRLQRLAHVRRQAGHQLGRRPVVLVDVLLGPARECDARRQRVQGQSALVDARGSGSGQQRRGHETAGGCLGDRNGFLALAEECGDLFGGGGEVWGREGRRR